MLQVGTDLLLFRFQGRSM